MRACFRANIFGFFSTAAFWICVFAVLLAMPGFDFDVPARVPLRIFLESAISIREDGETAAVANVEKVERTDETVPPQASVLPKKVEIAAAEIVPKRKLPTEKIAPKTSAEIGGRAKKNDDERPAENSASAKRAAVSGGEKKDENLASPVEKKADFRLTAETRKVKAAFPSFAAIAGGFSIRDDSAKLHVLKETPAFSIESEAAVPSNGTVSFRVMPNGSVPLATISVSADFPSQIVDEMKMKMAKWRFEPSSSAGVVSAECRVFFDEK